MNKELVKVNKKLDELHKKEDAMGIHGNGTMRKAKLHINIEYYCRLKDNIFRDIEIANLALIKGKWDNIHIHPDSLIKRALNDNKATK